MIKKIDLRTDLANLVRLEGRGAHTTEAEAQAIDRHAGGLP